MTQALGPLARIYCQPANRESIISPVLCGPGGAPCLNGAASYQKWYQGGFLVNNAFPAVAANATVMASLKAQPSDNQAGDLVISQLLGRWTDRRLAVRLYNQWLDHWYSNVAIPVELLFGSPSWPSKLLGPIFVKSGTALQAEITELSGASNTATLMGRGYRSLVPPGGGQQASLVERFFWEKARRFRPYFLGPVDGPQVPQSGATALAAEASQTFTFEVPSVGDFYMMTPVLIVMSPRQGATIQDIEISSWTEGGPAASFIDSNILPLRAHDVFATSWANVLNDFAAFARAGNVPGGWGGDPDADEGQWFHRLHRGTQMFVGITNKSSVSVRIFIGFLGFLGTCETPPGANEYLSFPQAMGQQTRPIAPRYPGDPACAPNCPSPPGGTIIIAPQAMPEPAPPAPVPAVRGARGMRGIAQTW